MKIIHKILNGSNGLPISLDFRFLEKMPIKGLVIFNHGFKGFKDWGAWNLVANTFSEEGFVFLKFNFSHNGTTTDNLFDFNNLDAFSENNYSRELEDLQIVIDWVKTKEFPFLASNKINLIGHSRGGGAVLVKSNEEENIHKTCTWASIDSFDRFGTDEQIQNWKQNGEHVFVNGRTGQKMPIKYQFYQDYVDNIERLDIQKSVRENTKPLLVVHGTKDPAVYFGSAEKIVSWSNSAELFAIKDADHVFGTKHPCTKNSLPTQMKMVVEKTIEFFKA